MTWLTHARVLLLVAVVVGSADALIALGWPVINPLNIDWLKGDPAAHYLGWAFYRQEPEWRFPLTWVTRLGYPVGVSVAYQDSIPLLAVSLRLLAPLLPDPFQYLGLYATLSFILQMYFGLLLSRRLCDANPVFTYAGGLLVLLSPILISRLHGHFQLGSHWLLLASLLVYFRITPTRARAGALAPFFLLFVLVGAIHPYLSVMCLLVALAAAARVIILDRGSWARVVMTCALLGITLVTSLAFFGFLGGADRSAQTSGVPGVLPQSPGTDQLRGVRHLSPSASRQASASLRGLQLSWRGGSPAHRGERGLSLPGRDGALQPSRPSPRRAVPRVPDPRALHDGDARALHAVQRAAAEIPGVVGGHLPILGPLRLAAALLDRAGRHRAALPAVEATPPARPCSCWPCSCNWPTWRRSTRTSAGTTTVASRTRCARGNGVSWDRATRGSRSSHRGSVPRPRGARTPIACSGSWRPLNTWRPIPTIPRGRRAGPGASTAGIFPAG